MPRVLLVYLGLLLGATGCTRKEQSLDDFQTTPLTFPGGQQIRVEVMREKLDMMRGMMFRDSLAADRGMLFIYGSPGLHTSYMYQVRVPLDVVWLSLDRRVVEMIPNIPPCPSTSAKQCPIFGGKEVSVYVLELPAGAAKRFGLQIGDQVKF